MAYTYDQKWPVEPRGSILHSPSGRSPDVTASSAIQAWRERTVIVSLLVQVASSYFIFSYDTSHSANQELAQSLYIHGREFQLPGLIRDPSPATFMLACLAYAFTAAAFYRLHPSDKYQYHFLVFAVGLATFLAYINIRTLRTWLPPFIIVAQVWSHFIHYIFPSLRAERIVEGEGPEVQNYEFRHAESLYKDKEHRALSSLTTSS